MKKVEKKKNDISKYLTLFDFVMTITAGDIIAIFCITVGLGLISRWFFEHLLFTGFVIIVIKIIISKITDYIIKHRQ